jgi:hypothetical protein
MTAAEPVSIVDKRRHASGKPAPKASATKGAGASVARRVENLETQLTEAAWYIAELQTVVKELVVGIALQQAAPALEAQAQQQREQFAQQVREALKGGFTKQPGR